jgi:hypothetical protein
MWKILQTAEFKWWFSTLDSAAKEDIYSAIAVLKQEGPALGRPRVDTLQNTNYPNLKELRVQSVGRPYRIIFAFNPKRNGVLLIGGNKQGNKNFYKKIIPIAEKLYEEHIKGN